MHDSHRYDCLRPLNMKNDQKMMSQSFYRRYNKIAITFKQQSKDACMTVIDMTAKHVKNDQKMRSQNF